jgi:hypothetical protein
MFEFIPTIKKGNKKEITFYAISLSISFIILFLFSLSIKIPNPTKGIEAVIKAIIPIK